MNDQKRRAVRRVMPTEGTRYMWMDPTGVERNWFFLWGLVDMWQRLWIYREWPCPRHPIPGVGLPGAWAEPGSSKTHKFGGIPGPGSRSVGFGLRQYKAEIARIEGWKDQDTDKPLEEWRDSNGARERVYLRYMDRRFGNTAHDRADGATTLQDELAELNLYFELITGQASQDGKGPISHGVDLINSALSFEDGWLELDILEQARRGPKLFISLECENLWFALRNYTGIGGWSEATKDPIDTLRYAIHSKPIYIPDGGFQMTAGRGPRGYGGGSDLTQTRPAWAQRKKGNQHERSYE
jgi:hypothetical protein